MPTVCHVNRNALLRALFLCTLFLLCPQSVQAHYDAASCRACEAQDLAVRFQSLLDAAVADGLPGVSLRIAGAGIDFLGAAGVADLVSGEPLTPAHTLYTASLGKTFTATVALQLCEEGLLDLDSPIERWLAQDLADRIPLSETITLRHLLSHTAGLVDYLNDRKPWRSAFVRDPRRRWSHADVVRYIVHEPLLFEPGSDFHYSNSNYILVGLIIERVTGRPLGELVRERITGPLKLKHTFNGAAGRQGRAHGYVRRHGRLIDTYPWYSHYGLADSGMNSTPADLARFIVSLFNSDLLLSEAAVEQLLHPSKLGHPPSDYGLGIYVQRNPWGLGRTWYAHDGIDPGYQADMMYLPELDLAIAIAANASMGEAGFIYERLIHAVVRTTLESVQVETAGI